MSETSFTHSRLANSDASRAVSCQALRRPLPSPRATGQMKNSAALVDGREQQHRLYAGHQDVASARRHKIGLTLGVDEDRGRQRHCGVRVYPDEFVDVRLADRDMGQDLFGADLASLIGRQPKRRQVGEDIGRIPVPRSARAVCRRVVICGRS